MEPIYTIQIYRTNPQKYCEEIENKANRLVSMINPKTEEDLLKCKKNFQNWNSDQWKFNEIIGFLEITPEYGSIGFNYDFRKVKTFRKGTNAKYGKQDYVNGAYIEWREFKKSEDLGMAILDCLNEIADRPEFRNRFLDLSGFKKIYLHLDWLKVIDENENLN